MLKQLTLFLIITLTISCQENTINVPNYDNEIETLNTPAKLANYYTQIATSDQIVRGEAITGVLQKNGPKSDEYAELMRLQQETDKSNLARIEKLYVKYGYPKTSEIGELAASAPWAVVQHARDLQDRLRAFPMMSEGYKNGEIDDTAFSMYLNRTYSMQNNGQRLRMQGTFKTKTQIDSLLTLLNLEL
ncbi:MAG: hypothetical protein ACI85O_000332 [Saprospiraceae bacterium]|jgi:hypothetical protein